MNNTVVLTFFKCFIVPTFFLCLHMFHLQPTSLLNVMSGFLIAKCWRCVTTTLYRYDAYNLYGHEKFWDLKTNFSSCLGMAVSQLTMIICISYQLLSVLLKKIFFIFFFTHPRQKASQCLNFKSGVMTGA